MINNDTLASVFVFTGSSYTAGALAVTPGLFGLGVLLGVVGTFLGCFLLIRGSKK
jgi:hypothetical protein